MSVLDKVRSIPLHFVIWVNPRGIFLTVHDDTEDESNDKMFVDAMKFESMKDLEFFVRENVSDWREAVEQSRAADAAPQGASKT